MELQIEIDNRGLSILNGLKKRSGLAGYKEILNTGLTLLDWALRQEAAGKVIAAVDEQKQMYMQVALEGFDSRKRHSKGRR
jgi:hypothetical protein